MAKMFSSILTQQEMLRKENFCYGTLVLSLSVCIISIPMLFFELYRNIVGQIPDKVYSELYYHSTREIWHYFYYAFVNVSIGYNPIFNLIHFFGMLTIVIFCGGTVEKTLGTVRLCVLSLFSRITQFILEIYLGSWGIGSSGIFLAYTPFIFYILIIEWKKRGKEIFHEFSNIFASTLLIITWIITPLFFSPLSGEIGGNYETIINFTNVVHLISITTGIIALFFWQKPLKKNLEAYTQGINFKGTSRAFQISFSYKVTIIFLILVVLVNIYILFKLLVLFFSLFEL
jgi:hypothetical protein